MKSITHKNPVDIWSNNVGPWIADHGLKIGIILLLGFIASYLLKKIIEKTIMRDPDTDDPIVRDSELKRKTTLARILKGAAGVVLTIITIIMILQEFNVQVGPILASLGVVGLAVGFGGQYLIRDVIAGLFIIIENQFRIGDWVDFGMARGSVEDISLRMTTLRDLEGTVHHVSNGEIKIVSNMSKYFSRINLDMGVAYHTDIEHLIRVVNEVGDELYEDPEWKERILKKPEFLRIQNFADSAIIFKILGEVKPLEKQVVMGELRKRLKIRFDKEGIEIPFPQIVVHQPKS